MSFSFVGVSGEGSTVVVNNDELPPSSFQAPLDTISTITPFSTIFSLNSFSNSFGGAFSTITTTPGFSTFGPWGSYPTAPEPPPEETVKKRYFEPVTSLASAAARKKRKQNFFEEEEATCAKCHYRRKCMKCINCFARFCEQRCLPRYLEDPTAQEEVKSTNTWLCPCCKGVEPPGKYKGSDILRKDVEETKEKEEEEDDTKSTPSITQQIIPQQTPIQTHVQPPSQPNYYMDQAQPSFPSQTPPSFGHYQPNAQQLQLQQLQQQQMKLHQMQQQQLQQHQLQHQMHQQQQQQQLQQLQQLQQQLPNQYPAQFQSTTQVGQMRPQMGSVQASQIQSPSQIKQDIGDENSDGSKTPGKVKVSNGIPANGGTAFPGEGDPAEYPKETEDFCAVCGDIYSYDDNNEIIYCDGCNVAVHQACYGVSKIPAGEWLCDRCKTKSLPACYLCSQKGGAMKELVDMPAHWVHVTCVATLFELRPLDYSNKIGPPGILEKIDKKRYNLKCSTCKERNRKDVTGPLIQCKSKRCTQAFHPICCKKKLTYCKELSIFVTYCSKHANEAPSQ